MADDRTRTDTACCHAPRNGCFQDSRAASCDVPTPFSVPSQSAEASESPIIDEEFVVDEVEEEEDAEAGGPVKRAGSEEDPIVDSDDMKDATECHPPAVSAAAFVLTLPSRHFCPACGETR